MRITENFREEHMLADGERIVVRAIAPGDAAELRRAFGELSPATRRNRFLLVRSELDDATLRYLTSVDFDTHVAVVATRVSHDLKSEIGLGVARFIRLPEDPTVAEAAVTVVDAEHRRGIGRILLTLLAESARERGVKAFSATVLATNEGMLCILNDLGAIVRRDDGDALLYQVPLDAGDRGVATSADRPLRRWLRGAAVSFAGFFR